MRPPFLMAHAGRDALSCHPLIACERPMTDVLDRVITYGPDFLDRSLKLLTQPKTFLCNVAASKHAVQHAVVCLPVLCDDRVHPGVAFSGGQAVVYDELKE